MSTKRKTVFKGFNYMHCDDFAKYLSDMALKGWHFKEWGIGLKFEKGEPRNVTYAVEVFPKASENDIFSDDEEVYLTKDQINIICDKMELR